MFVTDPPDTMYPLYPFLREIITALDAQSPCTLSFATGCIPLPFLLQNISIPVLLKSFILKKSKKDKNSFSQGPVCTPVSIVSLVYCLLLRIERMPTASHSKPLSFQGML